MNERRSTGCPTQASLRATMNEAQVLMLRRLEDFGWRLEFIRRPLFQDVVPVLRHPDNNIRACLNADGILDMQSPIRVRM